MGKREKIERKDGERSRERVSCKISRNEGINWEDQRYSEKVGREISWALVQF